MEASESVPDRSSHRDITYPEVDELVRYPSGQIQSIANQVRISSVLDPRLYNEPSASRDADAPDHDIQHDDADAYFASSSKNFFGEDLDLDDSSEDPSFIESEESSLSNEEMLDVGQEVEDEEGFSARHRRRRGGPFSGRFGARGGRGIKRGPRRPLEPSPEFKFLHSEATSAFIDGDYDRAIDLVKKAIQINPEMFAAHSLLSEIFLAQGQKDKALTALFSGAHTRPKDSSVWLKVAKLILDLAGEDRQAVLNDVIYCYSRVVDIDPKNYSARFRRAAIYRELGYNGRAATEYERILRELPHNTRALRHLAETYIDLDDIQKAIDRYTRSINYYMSLETGHINFSWSDVNIFVELFGYSKKYEEGLRLLKLLSRWLLSRKDDMIWKEFERDDREWDADDIPRRIKTTGYEPSVYPRNSYGLGLPLELRIRMGIYRLKMGDDHKDEALNHFEWLNPENISTGARLYDYGDLFREAADALKEAGLFQDALRYYEPLQQTDEHADVSFFIAMGECAMHCDKLEEAENYFLTVVEHDARNMEARFQLARLYENIGMTERALKYVNEAVLFGRQETGRRRRRRNTRVQQLAREFRSTEPDGDTVDFRDLALDHPTHAPTSTLTTRSAAVTARRRLAHDEIQGGGQDHIQYLHSKMMELRPAMREGNLEAIEDWLDIADALLRDFRSNRVFYPLQRNMVFLGYSRDTQKKAGKHKSKTLMDEMQEMAGRLQESLGKLSDEPSQTLIPTDYHGISFDDWLDIFLEYAFVVAGQSDAEEAYDALAAAADASVWYHSKTNTLQIHICWFTCALRLRDEETLSSEARWFVKEYQFVTDVYRLFAILSRLCGDPHKSLFHSSPNMKFMLRQIKAMDFTLPDDPSRLKPAQRTRHSIYQERAALSTRDELGEAIPAEELDVALLVLYGHILYSGNSFYPALNYFFRAYALDDQNPSILLSIALCYIHQSLKRQSENRHYLIMQGLSFMHEYRRIRSREGVSLQERQEMEFNFARMWHSLGLVHLAVEGYQRALSLGEQIQVKSQREGAEYALVENFSAEAAMALQTIYTVNGDLSAAWEVTQKWLVI